MIVVDMDPSISDDSDAGVDHGATIEDVLTGRATRATFEASLIQTKDAMLGLLPA